MKNLSSITKSQIIMLTDVTETELELWIRNGLGKFKTGTDSFDAHEFYMWYRDTIYKPKLQEAVTEDSIHLDVGVYKARYERARADKYIIKLQKLRDQYITKAQTEHTLYEMADLLGNILERLPDGLAEICVDNDEPTMLTGIDEYVRAELIEYSKMGD